MLGLGHETILFPICLTMTLCFAFMNEHRICCTDICKLWLDANKLLYNHKSIVIQFVDAQMDYQVRKSSVKIFAYCEYSTSYIVHVCFCALIWWVNVLSPFTRRMVDLVTSEIILKGMFKSLSWHQQPEQCEETTRILNSNQLFAIQIMRYLSNLVIAVWLSRLT